MKLLLIGFANQSASVLSVLIERTYPDWTCEIVERRVGKDNQMKLPVIASNHQDANALVINTQGIGMDSFLPEYVSALRRFIGVRAALIVSRGDLALWQGSGVLPDGFGFLIKSPFSKAEITDALSTLIVAAMQVENNRDKFVSEEVEVLPVSMLASTSDIVPVPPKLRASHTFIHKVLDVHFQVAQNPLFHELLDVSLTEGTVKVTMGTQTFYMDQTQNLALVVNIDRLIDYCDVLRVSSEAKGVVVMEAMPQEAFNRLAAQSPANGYQKYAINTLLWRLYSEVLPLTIDVPDHHLLLKMRYMPNFALTSKNVPDEVRSLVSSCIVAPRGLLHLEQQELDDLQNKAMFNRVFLLALLSGVADVDVLRDSFERPNTQQSALPTVEDEEEARAHAEKAARSGFFKRLLSKLKF